MKLVRICSIYAGKRKRSPSLHLFLEKYTERMDDKGWCVNGREKEAEKTVEQTMYTASLSNLHSSPSTSLGLCFSEYG